MKHAVAATLPLIHGLRYKSHDTNKHVRFKNILSFGAFICQNIRLSRNEMK